MTEHYTVKSGVILSLKVKQKVKAVADKYYKLTKKGIVVTSGARSSTSQADAMYGKLAGGDKLTVYKNQTAAQAVKKAYDDAVESKKNPVEIKKAIKEIIDEQIKNKVYISKHLKEGAVDVRSRDMSLTEKTQFKKAASGVATIVILETTPPHFHLQF